MKAVLTGGESAASGTESIRLRGERGDFGFLISRGFPLQPIQMAKNRSLFHPQTMAHFPKPCHAVVETS